MSKSVKKVVGIVAAIAIPFAAPAIAGAIGLSGAIGATLGSAVTGAVLGGVTSQLTGGDWRRGALLGGLSGGIGGYMQGAQAGASAPVSEAVPSYVAPGEAGAAGLAETGVAGGTATTGAGGFAGAVAPTEGFVGATTGAPVMEAVPSYIAPEAAAAGTAPVGLSGVPGGAPVTEAIPAYVAPTGGATAATAAGTAAPAAPTTFMQALRRVPEAVAAKFRDPNALADLTLRAAGMMAGSAIAGSGLSPEEEALLQAQRQELEYLQANNQALFQERLNQARGLLGEAKYFDPNYFGLQQAAGVQLRGARAKEEALAGIDPRRAGLRSAEERRANLAIGRDVGTAYSQGYQRGVEGRTGLLQSGLQQLPTSAPATALGSYGAQLASMYGTAADRQAQTQQDIGSFFESMRSPYQTEEERQRGSMARQGLFG